LLTVKARFVSGTSHYNLDTVELRVPVHWRRSFVIAVVHPDGSAFAESGPEFWDSLRLDRLHVNQHQSDGLVSIPSRITPSDLRTGGLGFFSFDLLALTGPGLSVLGASQLEAIGDWVEAGGSLLVIADRTLTIAQANFLNRMAGLSEDDSTWHINTTDRRQQTAVELNAKYRRYRPGLGRAVVLPAPPDPDQLAELRELVAFLWKLRADRLSEFRETGTWKIPPQDASPSQTGAFNDPYRPRRPYQPIPLVETDSLVTILLPEEVQGLPFAVVVSILTTFLIVIVPVDYLLLGYLKRRRYTWILLPIVSLAFTWLTVALGNAYLGSTDYRTSLEFLDLAAGDRVIRSSRFELLFTATQREATTNLQQTLHVTMPAQKKTTDDDWDSPGALLTFNEKNQTAGATEHPLKPELPMYEGALPASFAVRQQMRKWSPQLSRQTALRTARPVPQFDLDHIEATLRAAPKVLAGAEWQRALRERIHESLPKADVLLFNRNQVFDLTHTAAPERQVETGSKHGQLLTLVRTVCVRPPHGLFSVVSQLSPNGAGDFEDLSLLDPGDADQWLLVIVAGQGNDYVVFRRLFHGEE
ncbi:MAG: hypothetical protein ABGZ35_23300, partial [Planctomycetaceae bacterium]